MELFTKSKKELIFLPEFLRMIKTILFLSIFFMLSLYRRSLSFNLSISSTEDEIYKSV